MRLPRFHLGVIMVIWPKAINVSDDAWRQACALMQVLALDLRKYSPRGYQRREYYESAEDFLVRPMIWENTKRVPAPYLQYALRFNVSASVHGSIPIDAADELEEFGRWVNAAIQSPLTVAQRKMWDICSERLKGERAGDYSMSGSLIEREREECAKAMFHYNDVRESIETSRRYTNFKAASLSRHEEILGGLIRLGVDMLQAA